jgi:uncharacterized protein (DUF58 family)
MRLTRRGKGVLGVALLGFLMAAMFGSRALNAVVLPAFVALVAGAVQLRNVDAPAVTRETPADGFPGETGTVTLRFETDDPFAGVVADSVPEGLDTDPAAVETTVGAGPVSYELRYEDRGEHVLGPVYLTARDVLGLVERDLTVAARSRLVVYPSVADLAPAAMNELQSLYDTARTDERDEFDRLRGYERGDPLRDVHWKSTAKYDDLVVKEFAADTQAQAVTVAAGAAVGAADAMAEAVASVALGLLSMGIPVEVYTPNGELSASVGGERAVLEHLARTGRGGVPAETADVEVVASTGTTTVRIGDVETTFGALVGSVPFGGDGDGETPRGRDDARSPAEEVAA